VDSCLRGGYETILPRGCTPAGGHAPTVPREISDSDESLGAAGPFDG
jgi:hypothetical protein